MSRKIAEVEVERTYRVVDRVTGGTINHVTCAENEKESDSLEERNKKRLMLALRHKEGWLTRYDPTLPLEVVACDLWGDPLNKRERAV